MDFIDRLCRLVATPPSLTEDERNAAILSFEDTIAVTLAGWGVKSAQAAREVFKGGTSRLLDDSHAQSPEHAAMIHAIAGHALDYDDVHLTSITHPSVVLVPALMALSEGRPHLAPRMVDAYAVGLGTNIALGEALGFGHYDQGWHATSTIGPLAGAAALSYLLGLDEEGARNAIALAAAQSGGLQRNFGTHAKHFQAGHAAASAIRAALLANAGIDGSPDIFGRGGFFDLFGSPRPVKELDAIHISPDTLSVSRKLFPCCYLTHRMIAAALKARTVLTDDLPPDARIIVEVPYGGMRALQIITPQNGTQAKFCAAYCVATALRQGRVGLSDFEDSAVFRPELQKIMAQIETTEDPLEGEMPVGIDHGTVRLRIERAGRTLAESEICHYPGSPDAPFEAQAFEAKIMDCLAIWQNETGRSLSLEPFRSSLRSRLDHHTLLETETGTTQDDQFRRHPYDHGTR